MAVSRWSTTTSEEAIQSPNHRVGMGDMTYHLSVVEILEEIN
ncbi:hypothetical protein ACZ87_03962 [Candidatus Erwinia dacicola]|uniref:Uncharacterized protein n=1 Tax=Candidatus Erwinia dacicola TaxID=252393 RepID=A0A328T9V7_9GAMM|nr:hypothetical protein ACZ87_03962 [Candidatus Erwinia dacicola]